jgi:hypothetical protein
MQDPAEGNEEVNVRWSFGFQILPTTHLELIVVAWKTLKTLVVLMERPLTTL